MKWESKSGGIFVKDMLDGLAYALTTAASLAWQWLAHA
jgi:hypothetical protein